MNFSTTKRKIGIVACCKQKMNCATPAKDLYRSPLFRYARRYVETVCEDWLILSAAHGVVTPDQWIAPYDVTLARMTGSARRLWREGVQETLHVRYRTEGVIFVVLAGELYRQALEGFTIENPLAGKGIGQQVAWLKEYAESDELTQWISFEGFDGERYWESEVNLLQPQLEALGFEVRRWWSSERDSFGPVIRAAECWKNGERRTFFYA